MDQQHSATRPHREPRLCRLEWETPVLEEIGVSAEVTAYMGAWKLDGE
jgi:coenzyme PQQ precursor peptide PqqA